MQVDEARRYRQPWLGAASRDARARHVFHSSPPIVSLGVRDSCYPVTTSARFRLLHAGQPALLQTASSGFRCGSLLAGSCRGIYCSIAPCPFMHLRLI
jgi:hypothetical protein